MNRMLSGLTEEIISTAEKNGVLLIGTTKIYEIQTAIVFGTPLNEHWRLDYTLSETKRMYEEYEITKAILNKISIILKKEGFTNTKYKTALSMHGDFRPLAVEAGVAHRGRNGLAINRKYSSGLIWSAIMTDAPVEIKTEPGILKCSQCKLCVKLCPSNALSEGRLNYRKCLPYALRGCAQCLKACRYAMDVGINV